MHYPSEIWVSDCSKSGENLTNNDNAIICQQYLVVDFFGPRCISLNKFRTWFKLHVNVVTNSEITKKTTPSEICPIFGTGVSKSYQSLHGCF